MIDRTTTMEPNTSRGSWSSSGTQTLGRRRSSSKRVRFNQSAPGLLTILHKATNCVWSDDRTFVHRLHSHWGGKGKTIYSYFHNILNNNVQLIQWLRNVVILLSSHWNIYRAPLQSNTQLRAGDTSHTTWEEQTWHQRSWKSQKSKSKYHNKKDSFIHYIYTYTIHNHSGIIWNQTLILLVTLDLDLSVRSYHWMISRQKCHVFRWHSLVNGNICWKTC